MIEGTSQVGKLALFILVIFIELISAHKSAKREREREKRELGQHPALGQWCVSSVAFALEFLNARKFKKHHIYHTAHLCTLLNFYRKNLSEDKKFGRNIYHKCSGQNKEEKKIQLLPGGESNPGLPRDRRGYSPLYYRGPGLRNLENLSYLLKYKQAHSPQFLEDRFCDWKRKVWLFNFIK